MLKPNSCTSDSEGFYMYLVWIFFFLSFYFTMLNLQLQLMKAVVIIQVHECVGAYDILTVVILATSVVTCMSSEPWLFWLSQQIAVDQLVPWWLELVSEWWEGWEKGVRVCGHRWRCCSWILLVCWCGGSGCCMWEKVWLSVLLVACSNVSPFSVVIRQLLRDDGVWS